MQSSQLPNTIIEDTAATSIDEDTSSRITALRFILSAFVVLTHSQINNSFIADNGLSLKLPVWFRVLQNALSESFALCAVPLFFAFSGYLHFSKPCSYGKLLQRKFVAIVIPYFLWTLSWLLVHYIFDRLNITKHPLHGKTARDWLSIFTGFPPNSEGGFYPLIGQFWYLRDLMLMFILSPIIKRVIDRAPLAYLFLAFVFWQSSLPLSYEWGSSFFFFSLCYYLVKYNIKAKVLDKITFRDLVAAYGLVLILQGTELALGRRDFGVLSFANRVLSCVILVRLSGIWCKNDKLFSLLKYLSSFSFWIYAVHIPFVLFIANKLAVKIIALSSIGFLLAFVFQFLFTVSVSLAAGILIKKYAAPIFNIYAGIRKTRGARGRVFY